MQTGTSILNPSVVANADKLQSEFRCGVPFPHLVIDDFLDLDFAELLSEQFPPFDCGNSMGDDGTPGGKSTVEAVRSLGTAYRRLDDCIRSPEFLLLLSRLTGIDGLIYDPWYLGGGTHESRDGTSLDPHIDANFHPVEPWHRRLNVVFYLNPSWEAEWGGSFELFRDPWTTSNAERQVPPTFNRCAIFATSEHSWHGFSQVRLPAAHAQRTRRSIALFFYTEVRPAAETVERHTVHYVKRQLPDDFTTGYVLSAHDVAWAKDVIAQRDAHIRQLYSENAALRNAQDSGLGGTLLYWAKRAFLRLRHAR